MLLSVESTSGVALIRNTEEHAIFFMLFCYISFNLNYFLNHFFGIDDLLKLWMPYFCLVPLLGLYFWLNEVTFRLL